MEYPMKGRPKIACPHCGARLLNAADKSVKNSTVAEVLERAQEYDYFIFCPKCKQYIGIKQQKSA